MFDEGRRAGNGYVTLIFLRQDNSRITSDEHDRTGRVAFIAGKRNGNAVWRNAAKRRMREVYLRERDKLRGIDILFVAKPRILSDSYSKVLEACEKTIDDVVARRRHRTVPRNE